MFWQLQIRTCFQKTDKHCSNQHQINLGLRIEWFFFGKYVAYIVLQNYEIWYPYWYDSGHFPRATWKLLQDVQSKIFFLIIDVQAVLCCTMKFAIIDWNLQEELTTIYNLTGRWANKEQGKREQTSSSSIPKTLKIINWVLFDWVFVFNVIKYESG